MMTANAVSSHSKKPCKKTSSGTNVSESKLSPLGSTEQKVAEYLVRAGCIPDPAILDIDQAERARILRERRYHSVASLLTQYRSLLIAYECHTEEFVERIHQEGGVETGQPQQGRLFGKLSSRLELLAVQDERRFQQIYAPQIIAGRRIETALDSLKFGLKVLKAEEEELYRLVDMFYLSGNKTPTIREVMEAFDIGGPNTFYGRIEKAVKLISKTMFGFADNKRELLSILVYLEQEVEDVVFPDF